MAYFAHARDPQPADLDALDRAALKAIILHQHAHARVQQERLSSRGSEIERLVLLVAKLNQMLFGRKSEKVLHQIALQDLLTETAEVRLILPLQRVAGPAETMRDDLRVSAPAMHRPLYRLSH